MSHPRTLELLEEGIAAVKAGDKERARPLLRAATALDARNESAWLWLAGAAETPAEALHCLERVLAVNPEHERARAAIGAARVQAGVAAAKVGDKTQARLLLRQTTQQDPGNELGWLWLASVAEPTEAVRCLERVLQIDPANERARAGLERFQTLLAPANGSERHSAPRRLPPQSASEAEVTLPAWDCPLCGRGEDEEQQECPGCGALLFLTDEARYPGSEWAEEAALRAAVERLTPAASTDFAAAYHLGLAYLNLGDDEGAVASLQEALRLRPDDAVLHAWLDARGLIASSAPAERTPARRRTVLVVGENPTLHKLAAQTLERVDCRVHSANSGYEAIDVLRDKGVPDLVFLAVVMEGMDGYQLCKLLRENADTAGLPIVLLTSKDGFFSKVRARMCGATDCLSKPFETDELLQTLEKYCPAADPAPAGSEA